MNFKDYHTQHLERVNDYLETRLRFDHETGPTQQLYEAMQYSLMVGGKRVRPLLVYATGQMFGASNELLDPIAAAVECVHSYSLIHDDLPAMDDDDLRRGRPTCHKAFDEATAILAGDALQTYAFELIATIPADKLPPVYVTQIMALLAKRSGSQGMVVGQILDLAAENTAISINALETIHRYKTGALIEASVLAGAYAAQISDPIQLSALTTYARAIGLAFQVQDDILDVEGNTETLGKTAGADIARHKATFPALLGLPASKEKAKRLHSEAKDALNELPFNSQRLAAIADFIVMRLA